MNKPKTLSDFYILESQQKIKKQLKQLKIDFFRRLREERVVFETWMDEWEDVTEKQLRKCLSQRQRNINLMKKHKEKGKEVDDNRIAELEIELAVIFCQLKAKEKRKT